MTYPKLSPEALRESYRLPDDDETLLAECDVAAMRTPGPGGQHKNTTLSSIRLVHRPSGVVVIGRRERSQRRNLEAALRRLRDRLAAMLVPPKPRRATKPTAAARAARLDAKRRRSRVKARRRAGEE